MATPLIKKLQIKPGQRILLLNAPDGYHEELGELPPGVEQVKSGPADLVQLFVASGQELKQLLPTALASVQPHTIFWICYPKLSGKIKSDLTRDEGWLPVGQAGYEGVAQVAVNDTWSALRFKPSERTSIPDVVAAQYAGARAALRPIYDKLAAAARNLGDDVDFGPRKTYVALHRKNQFAVIQPSTNSRVDLGLRLKNPPTSDRLLPATNVGGGSITHRVALTAPDQIDAEVLSWLKAAYDDMA
jgi:predicted transport protein